MQKQKITISLDSEIAEKLRLQSIEKYHNSRSMSRLIEDLATGAAEVKQPEACSILGHRTDRSLIEQRDFNEIVSKIKDHLATLDRTHVINGNEFPFTDPEMYFALKEVCELELNRLADNVNRCTGCHNLTGPLPKFPDAGRNFELFAMMDSSLR